MGSHRCEEAGQPQRTRCGGPAVPPSTAAGCLSAPAVPTPGGLGAYQAALSSAPVPQFPPCAQQSEVGHPGPCVGGEAHAPTHGPVQPPTSSPARRGCRPRRGPAAGMCSAERNVPNHSQMCAAASPPPPSAAHRGGRWAPGTPHRPVAGLPAGPNPSPDGSCPATGPSPSLSRGVGVPRSGEARAGRRDAGARTGGVTGAGLRPRCHRLAEAPQPSPSKGAPVSVRWGRAGSCPAPPVPVPGRSAAERKGAVRWNLGAGGDGAAGGGRARHVAAYVRKVQGRTGRRPGRWGHRHGDTEPPPRTCGRLRSRTRTLGAARGAAGRCPALWAWHVRARVRGCGNTCARVGGTRPRRPLGLPVLLLPLRLPALA